MLRFVTNIRGTLTQVVGENKNNKQKVKGVYYL